MPRTRTRTVSPDQGTLFDLGELTAPPPPAPVIVSLPPTGDVARVKANLAALATVRALAADNRPATPDEAQTLAGWSGWGAVPGVFDQARDGWAWARHRLRELLTVDDYKAAAQSTLNAHYTDPAIAAALWNAVTALGFTGGRVLEPGCGSGNFILTAPPAASVTGVEIDPTTAAICQARCPNAKIITGSFATVRLPGLFDLVIGNVPFGKITLHDPDHNSGKHSIHNHFVIKALHLTRPGGLVAVLTSRYTLDSLIGNARREMHSLGDLVTAVRLPSGAHQAVAGTRVVMDLLILRRREPGREALSDRWLGTTQLDVDGNTLTVNQRFAEGCRVLGTMRAIHGAYRGGDLSVEPASAWRDDLKMWLDGDARAATASGLGWSPSAVSDPEPEPELADADLQDGHILHRNGQFHRAENGGITSHHVPSTQHKELAALLELRNAALAVLEDEVQNDADTPRLITRRHRLRAAYEAYTAAWGPLNRTSQRRTGRCTAAGDEIMATVRPPMGGFRTDPHAPLVFALEDYDPESHVAEPAPILTRRVVARREHPATAETPADALAICLDSHGRVDLGVIARLLGTDLTSARQQLGDLVFNDPGTDEGRGLLPAAEYLSGNVRAKLRAAETAVQDNPRYEPNVEALRKVLPSDLTPGEIDARMGAVWISATTVQQFLREILDDSRLTVDHPGGQFWHVDGNLHSVRARSTWGTKRYPAPDLAQTILEQRRIEVRDRGFDDKYVINPDETAAANEKAAEMQERFAEWMWENPLRARDGARKYNDLLNAIVLRSYDDAKLLLPGLSAAVTPHKHQVSAIARIIAEPSVLLAHDTGAGKTIELICGVTELRRLGLIRKPCIVVPGHTIDQWAGEWMRTYPLARLLITRKEDLQGDNRRRFVARIATGDWDAVIMSSSAFERIPLSPRVLKDYLDKETAQIQAWLDTATSGKSRTVKRIEATLLRAKERVKAKLDSVKDAGISFEATGVDYLGIDEAHRYKNLRTVSSISDAAIDGSQRATDLDAKLCWLRDRNGDRVATFATATPIANSITEIHVMQRYLRPGDLETRDLLVFDSWAATFGEQVTEVELAPEGGGTFRLKTRFAKFRNVPELLRLFHLFADVKLGDDLDLPVPLLAETEDGKREPVTVTVPISVALENYVTALCERAVKIRNKQVKPDEDNMLKVTGDGRKAALDMRLVYGLQDEPGKIAAAAENIHRIWEQNKDRVYSGPGGVSPITGSLQIVMADLGTPRPGWNAYDELRDQLHTLGIPGGMVRFIHEAKTDRAKAALFAACKAGNVAVLVGSTEKMGIGTNVQDRCIALHHLDAPWRPADIKQRDGRILRQGNHNPEVQIYRYIVARSFDGYSWQILARKARFIAQVLRGRLDVREIEDIGDTALSYAEVKAIATGNPLLMEEAAASAVVARLQRAERAHNRNQSLLASTARQDSLYAAKLREEAAAASAAEARRVDTRGDKFTMTVNGVTYVKRSEAGDALAEHIETEVRVVRARGRESLTSRPGTLAGFSVLVKAFSKAGASVWLDGVPSTELSLSWADAEDGASVIKRLEYRLSRLATIAADALASAERREAEAAKAEADLGAPFPRAEELAAAVAELDRIHAALDALARAPENKGAAA